MLDDETSSKAKAKSAKEAGRRKKQKERVKKDAALKGSSASPFADRVRA